MPPIDTSLFLDIADALGISSPAIIEKDYWATQLLSDISKLEPQGYQLIFSGGTCLAKAHQNTFRMSEDIDIKMVPGEQTLRRPKNQQQQLRRALHQMILNVIEQSDSFSLVDSPKKRSESKFQRFTIEYPRKHERLESLRPHLQLDLTESILLEPPIGLSLGSIYADSANSEKEIQNIFCVSVNTTAIEKFISLLRRTAAHARNNTREDDETLIRHVYDLHLIQGSMEEPEKLKGLVQQVINIDREQFGSQHPEFVSDARSELLYGLSILIEQPQHRERYKRFIGPLVYHPSPAKWDEAIASIQTFARYWL